jgi:hypothetical protein
VTTKRIKLQNLQTTFQLLFCCKSGRRLHSSKRQKLKRQKSSSADFAAVRSEHGGGAILQVEDSRIRQLYASRPFFHAQIRPNPAEISSMCPAAVVQLGLRPRDRCPSASA